MSGSSKRISGPRVAESSLRLEADRIETAYGRFEVLRGASLEVRSGEIAAIVGPNGAGKTTLLKTLAGFLHPRRGSVRVNGEDVSRLPPHRILALGIAYVAQGQDLFPWMTVEENVEMGGYLLGSAAERRSRRERLLERFPILVRRRTQPAFGLSGGERQALKLSRALMMQPSLLLLDEPSAGLAPILVRNVFDDLRRMVDSSGIGVLLAEQNVTEALRVAHRVYILSLGRIAAAGTPREILDQDLIRRHYLGTGLPRP